MPRKAKKAQEEVKEDAVIDNGAADEARDSDADTETEDFESDSSWGDEGDEDDESSYE